MSESKILVAEQFDDLEQQKETSTLGMWVFLATEVLFFGVLFMSYIVLRSIYPHGFAEASHECNRLYGTINTAILLTSSLTMALAVHAEVPLETLASMHYAYPTFHRAVDVAVTSML